MSPILGQVSTVSPAFAKGEPVLVRGEIFTVPIGLEKIEELAPKLIASGIIAGIAPQIISSNFRRRTTGSTEIRIQNMSFSWVSKDENGLVVATPQSPNVTTRTLDAIEVTQIVTKAVPGSRAINVPDLMYLLVAFPEVITKIRSIVVLGDKWVDPNDPKKQIQVVQTLFKELVRVPIDEVGKMKFGLRFNYPFVLPSAAANQ